MRTYIFEYIVYTRIMGGVLVPERKQKGVRSKNITRSYKKIIFGI